MLRKALGMSQSELAEGLRLTFQQVQKYEKGANRIGASRLQQIATILKVEPSFFFNGAPGRQGAKAGDAKDLTSMTDFATSNEGLALIQAFMAVKDAKMRRGLVDLVERIAAG